jgi:hypothetical protein
MPKADPRYYSAWWVWFQTRALSLARTGQFDPLKEFLTEGGNVVLGLLELIDSLRGVFSGNLLAIISKARKWAGDHRDPLEETRNRIAAMYLRWKSPATGPTGGTGNG